MSKYTLFLDESGRSTYKIQIGHSREKRVFIAAGLAIKDTHLRNLNKKCVELIGRKGIELHCTKIIKRVEQFSYLKNYDESSNLIKKVIELIQNIDARLFVTVMDKPVYRLYEQKEIRDYKPHEITWAHIVCRFAEFLEKHNHVGSVEHDKKEEKFDVEFAGIINNNAADVRMSPKSCADNIARISNRIKPKDSKKSRGIQLADICVGVMRRRHIYDDVSFRRLMKPLYHNKEHRGGGQEPRMFPAHQFGVPVSVTPKSRRLIVCPNGRFNKSYADARSMIQAYVSKSNDKSEKFLVHITDKFHIYVEQERRLKGNSAGTGSKRWVLQKSMPLNPMPEPHDIFHGSRNDRKVR